MLRKFISGMVFGAGFFIGMAIIGTIVVNFGPGFVNTWNGDVIVEEAPKIQTKQKYLGSSGVYVGGFLSKQKGVLAKGPGKIVGYAFDEVNPVKGLRLRLALNGSIMSSWTVTDDQGKYEINVPYGEYRIDGFEFDSETANRTLPNKIEKPIMSHSTGEFVVSESEAGVGLTFKFTTPVIKTTVNKKFSLSDEITLDWEDYPNAKEYSVYLSEKDDLNGYDWRSIYNGNVHSSSFNLSENGVSVNQGKYYQYRISAISDSHSTISNSVEKYDGFDFHVLMEK